MTFKNLSLYFEKIENTSSRLAITEILADLFNNLTQEEIEKVVYLLQGRLTPLYQKLDFGMAEKMIIKSCLLALNLEKKVFLERYQRIGDLGKTVEAFKKERKSFLEKELTINQVYQGLLRLARAAGEGSQEIKLNLLAELIRNIDSLSCRYLVRIPAGIMRLGFSDMTILDGFSWMIKGNKSLRPIIEKAYHVRPDLGLIGKILRELGVEGLKNIKPAVFTPILMMKAERLTSASEIIEKIGRCSVEPKYDGFRLQVHLKKNEVRLFSRNLEEVSFMYPDLIEAVRKQAMANEVIFEGEAIGFNPQTGDFLPFQETVQRKRKYQIEEKAKEIPLKLFAFELLYLNGESLLETPFLKRRRLLSSIIKKTGDIFSDVVLLAEDKIVEQPKQLNFLFEEAVTKGLEGIVAKKLEGIYQPGARGWNWIKYKRSYSGKLQDTIDCLMMGYDLGKGKRAKFGIGAFLVGVFDEEKDKFVTVAKIGTGLSDEEWQQLKNKSSAFKTQNQPKEYEVDKTMVCDVWLRPAIVVEIRADEISRSPVHTAGRTMKPTKTGQALEVDTPGFALRFPRLERFRDDKRPEEVTTLKEIKTMFKSQR